MASMECIYTTQDLAMLSHLKNALEAQGIECILRGQHLLGGVGELPPIECWPELCVVDDRQGPEARSHIDNLLARDGIDESPWNCAGCGEESPGTFTECWKCGGARAKWRVAG